MYYTFNIILILINNYIITSIGSYCIGHAG